MKICIIGYTGFVGQVIYNNLKNKHDVLGINSTTTSIPKDYFDIIINCAGNAKKYLAKKKPYTDFSITTNIFQTILKLKFKKLIHISSIAALYAPDNNYTISKLIAEKCCKLYYPHSVILRLGGLVGKNLTKNVVYDIAHNKNLFVTLDSVYNYISTEEVAKIINRIITLGIKNKIFNIVANKSISVKDIISEAKKHSIIFKGKEGFQWESYDNIDINNLKTIFTPKDSRHYIKNYLQYLLKMKHISKQK